MQRVRQTKHEWEMLKQCFYIEERLQINYLYISKEELRRDIKI